MNHKFGGGARYVYCHNLDLIVVIGTSIWIRTSSNLFLIFTFFLDSGRIVELAIDRVI